MTDRIERIVDHMLRVAKDGDDLHSEVTHGPETEDTEVWTKTANGVEVWLDIVYPAMARIPASLLRTLSMDEARTELIKIVGSKDASYPPYLEKKWGVPTG